MTLAELLQYSNLLLFPAVAYIVRLEGRIGRLEILLETMAKGLDGHMKREEIMIGNIIHKGGQ